MAKNKRLKIAVEVSGHLRTFEYCGALLKENLLNHYDCDVFIHTWDKTEHQQLSWHGKKGMHGGADINLVTEGIKIKVQNIYKPKKIIYDNEKELKKISGFLAHPNKQANFLGFSLQAVWNTLYTEVKAHQLMKQYAKENNIEYDFVIRTRFDIGLLQKFDIKPYLPFFNLDKNSGVFFPLNIKSHGIENDFSDNKHLAILHPYAFDVFYLTTPQAMDKIMNILDDFDTLFKKMPELLSPVLKFNVWTRNIEVIFLLYIQKMGILPYFGKIHYVLKRKNIHYDASPVFIKKYENRNILHRLYRKIKNYLR